MADGAVPGPGEPGSSAATLPEGGRRRLLPPSRAVRRLPACALALGATIALPHADEPGEGSPVRVATGRVCLSTLTSELELSCGTYGFGDLRHVCRTDATSVRCARTSAVTVRNTGYSVVYVTAISGPRQGVREQGKDQTLAPKQSATLSPGAARILFDITMRRTGDAPGRIEVTHVK
ncbi:hypothetical protein [Streptomyces sp. NBC_00878]|uniref:hypothetical protein n=1 Tax=Streptomyces sp. NBC_00878 TaxID=2975854 RepID=UPI002252F29F|nr:hypothetical protein [Streptomyces sp. NBC_00878]MCX4904378.1 hypothetical protein [Streptomyces sp. NBC_00878]